MNERGERVGQSNVSPVIERALKEKRSEARVKSDERRGKR
jgi:hypothetical protein